MKFLGNFSEGFFWKNFFAEFFERNFFGGFFWEDFLRGFFWRIFLEDFFGGLLGGFFWEEFLRRRSLFTLELTCLSGFWFLSRFWGNDTRKEGSRIFNP